MSNDKAGNNLDSDEVFIISSPLCIGMGWCCAPKHMTCEEIQQALLHSGKDYIPGRTPWTVTPREHEDETLQSPGKCAEHPDRQHWFLIGGSTGVVLLAMSGDNEGFPKDLPLQFYDKEDIVEAG